MVDSLNKTDTISKHSSDKRNHPHLYNIEILLFQFI